MSFFAPLSLLPEDPILGITASFNADPRPTKVNLGVGAYKDAESKPFVFNSVLKAEQFLFEQRLDKEYLPIDGDPLYIREILKLIFGQQSKALLSKRLIGLQALGGTGALRLGGDLCVKVGINAVYLPVPTWANHAPLFSTTGLQVEGYPYYDMHHHRFDFEAMCFAIQAMPKKSVILMQASCHNPTGMDPSQEQWKVLSSLIKEKGLLPFFDIAYQGFDRGVEEDVWAVRHFLEEGHEMICSYSCAKNFGLYGERAGLLAVALNNNAIQQSVGSHLKVMARTMYSNPPLHGARIVKTVLTDPLLKEEWLLELRYIRDRIKEMRVALIAGLQAHAKKRDFSFMLDQKGMFSFCGLDQDEVQQLRQEQGIYMLSNGRINVAGLNPRNINYVVDALLAVLNA